jgi:hypothetical protein
MSKGLAILASLKAILIAASVAVARGDMLPVVLISILLNLTQLGAKPIGTAARPGCESAESKSKPQTSDACNQVSDDGLGSTRNSQKFG